MTLGQAFPPGLAAASIRRQLRPRADVEVVVPAAWRAAVRGALERVLGAYRVGR